MCKVVPNSISAIPVTLINPGNQKRYVAYRCRVCGCQIMKFLWGFEHTHDRIFDQEIVKSSGKQG
jgi:hypothetical protein